MKIWTRTALFSLTVISLVGCQSQSEEPGSSVAPVSVSVPVPVEEEPPPKPERFDLNVRSVKLVEGRVNRQLIGHRYKVEPGPSPHHPKNTWTLHDEDVEDWDEFIEKLLDTTKVNGQLTIREHAQALATDDEETLAKLGHPQQNDSDVWRRFTLNGEIGTAYWFDPRYTYSSGAFSHLEDVLKGDGERQTVYPTRTPDLLEPLED